MTSKEFLRRVDYYSVFDDCPFLSEPSVFTVCFKVVLYSNVFKRSVTRFCGHPTFAVFGESSIRDASSIYFERFTWNQFQTELKFFKAFLSRLSFNQFVALCDKRCCMRLLSYLYINKDMSVLSFITDDFNPFE